MRALFATLALSLLSPIAAAQAPRASVTFEIDHDAVRAAQISRSSTTAFDTLYRQRVFIHRDQVNRLDGYTYVLEYPRQRALAMRTLRSDRETTDAGAPLYDFSTTGNRIEAKLTPEGEAYFTAQERAHTFELVRRRAQLFGYAAEQRDDGRIVVNSDTADEAAIRQAMQPTGRLTFSLVVTPEDEGDLPPNGRALPYLDAQRGHEFVSEDVLLDGAHVVVGEAGTDTMSGQPTLNVALDSFGTRAFCQITGEHVGDRIAIVLNGRVLIAPRINEAICGGQLQITGPGSSGSENEAIAAELREGVLVAPIRVAAGAH